jgi:hypothetical protein
MGTHGCLSKAAGYTGTSVLVRNFRSVRSWSSIVPRRTAVCVMGVIGVIASRRKQVIPLLLLHVLMAENSGSPAKLRSWALKVTIGTRWNQKALAHEGPMSHIYASSDKVKLL